MSVLARIARGAIYAVLIGAAVWIILNGLYRTGLFTSRPQPRVSLSSSTPDLDDLGVPTYPSARLAPGESRVTAPMPGGTAYQFRYRVAASPEDVVKFYERHLRNTSKPSTGSPFVAGRSRFGDVVTVVPDPREIRIRRNGHERTVTYTEILITVRRPAEDLR